jgi:Rieske Fe-S protein
MTIDAERPETPDGGGSEVTRRVMLRGAGVTGVALPFLAACGSDDGGGDTASGSGSSSDPADPAPSASSGEGGGAGSTVAAADVPVGGGTVVKDAKVVVTQPTDGDFKAFSAVCTHQGCLVNKVEDGEIQCPCHGSRYSIEDGSVQGGPAPEPLESKQVSVSGGEITVT